MKYLIRTCIFLFLISGALSIFAQDGVLQPDPKEGVKKVLVIPYNPDYYLSDSDRDISQFSGKNIKDVRKKMRDDLTFYTEKELSTSYPTHAISAKNGAVEAEELKEIYSKLKYQYDTTTSYQLDNLPDTSNQVEKIVKAMKQKMKTMGPRNEMVSIEKEAAYEVVFLNASIQDPSLLASLASKYDNDYFVFINQLEIKINYNNCIDLANKNYVREFKMHYSVFNVDGKLMWGDVATTLFPSNTNDLDLVIKNNFPLMAKYVNTHLVKNN